jgi:hypothetical protein
LSRFISYAMDSESLPIDIQLNQNHY